MSSPITFRGISRRSMHIISSSKGKSMKAVQNPHKLSQNGFAALTALHQTPQVSSARDIEALLSNIGADYRASRVTIESMIQCAGTATKAEPQPCHLSATELIDLIALIRSI